MRRRTRSAVKGSGPVRTRCLTLHGWQALVLENEKVAVTVLPEYGGWIWSIRYKPRHCELLWQCPRGLPSHDDPPVVTDPLYAYHARTLGAWPEIFPHGSAPTEAYGAKLPMHGEVALRAWECEIVRNSEDEPTVHMAVECHLLPLRLERTLKLEAGGARLRLEETVTNYSAVPVDFMWGHHPLFAAPLLSAESRIVAPARYWLNDDAFRPHPWPGRGSRNKAACPAQGAETCEMFYLDSLAAGWCALLNPVERIAAILSWDLDVFRYVWIWREANKAKGYPYFGRAYAVALEPFSSLPGAREKGLRMLHLNGSATLTSWLNLTIVEGLTAIEPESFDIETVSAGI
ncbi:MAG: DUF4432 family protein [Kiritimatiellia bacterium]